MPTKSLESVVLLQLPDGTLRTALEEALRAAASVHSVRDTAELVTVSSHPTMTELGLYAHEQGGKPVAILIQEQAPDPGLTLLHEIGHYLDQHAFGAIGYASLSLELAEWRNLVLQSQGVADLIAHWVTPPTVPGGSPPAVVQAVRAHVEYLLGPRELFARSYCQYIAARSQDEKLCVELENALKPVYREQWHEEDFGPIADALDDVFDQLGWR